MKKKSFITIIIPAYNEENNISLLLSDLLKQKQISFKIEKIIVLSDHSQDDTVKKARSIKSKIISVIDMPKRNGKNKLINYFFKSFTGKYLIQLDADIRIKNNLAIEHLAEKLMEGNDLVCGYHQAIQPSSFIQSLAYFGSEVWEKARSLSGKQAEAFACIGQIRGFSKKYIRHFRLPTKFFVMEDTYSYFFAVKNGYKISFAPNSIVYFGLPDNFSDYVSQMVRFLKTPDSLSGLFNQKMLAQRATISSKIKLIALLQMGVKKPLIACGYLVLQLIPKFQVKFHTQKPIWSMITSSKKLNKLK